MDDLPKIRFSGFHRKTRKITQQKEAHSGVLLADRGVPTGAGRGDGLPERIRIVHFTSENEIWGFCQTGGYAGSPTENGDTGGVVLPGRCPGRRYRVRYDGDRGLRGGRGNLHPFVKEWRGPALRSRQGHDTEKGWRERTGCVGFFDRMFWKNYVHDADIFPDNFLDFFLCGRNFPERNSITVMPDAGKCRDMREPPSVP